MAARQGPGTSQGRDLARPGSWAPGGKQGCGRQGPEPVLRQGLLCSRLQPRPLLGPGPGCAHPVHLWGPGPGTAQPPVWTGPASQTCWPAPPASQGPFLQPRRGRQAGLWASGGLRSGVQCVTDPPGLPGHPAKPPERRSVLHKGAAGSSGRGARTQPPTRTLCPLQGPPTRRQGPQACPRKAAPLSHDGPSPGALTPVEVFTPGPHCAPGSGWAPPEPGRRLSRAAVTAGKVRGRGPCSLPPTCLPWGRSGPWGQGLRASSGEERAKDGLTPPPPVTRPTAPLRPWPEVPSMPHGTPGPQLTGWEAPRTLD